MTPPEPIALELPLKYLGSVNVWLLPGDPVTLIDTGSATPESLQELERQLELHGVAFSDIEQVLLTHHHLDHTALAEEIASRSGAKVISHRGTAQWGERWAARVGTEERFTRELVVEHGVPDTADVAEALNGFLELIRTDGRPYRVDRVLRDGDVVQAGGRSLRTVYRPGHSITDTLFIDDDHGAAFVGDHLLANISSGAELMPTEMPGDERRRGLMEYLGNLRKTQVMAMARCFSGHGPIIEDHASLIDERITFHTDRLNRIHGLVVEGCETAYDISCRLWSEATAVDSPVLVVWEVLGHLDLLINRGIVREEIDLAGTRRFFSREPAALIAPIG